MIEAGAAVVEHVVRGFGLAAGAGEARLEVVRRGAVGRIWRLELPRRTYALKELFRPTEEQAARREAAITAHFARAGVLVPDSVAAADGRFVVELPQDLGGGWLRLYRWVAGPPADPRHPGTPQRLGELLARLHRHAPAAVDDGDRWYETVPEPDTWKALADRAGPAPWAAALRERTALLHELAGIVTEGPRAGLLACHRDLHPGNVLVEDGQLVPLDWDDAGPAHPDRELGIVLLRWHGDDVEAAARTVRAYERAQGPGRLRDQTVFSMAVACDLNFLAWQADRALDPALAEEHRAHAVEELQETLATLPSPRTLRRLLELTR